MKANQLVLTGLFLLSAAVFQLAAQQNETDRKAVEEIKAKAEAGDADSEYQFLSLTCIRSPIHPESAISRSIEAVSSSGVIWRKGGGILLVL
jgi:hypothetical protein